MLQLHKQTCRYSCTPFSRHIYHKECEKINKNTRAILIHFGSSNHVIEYIFPHVDLSKVISSPENVKEIFHSIFVVCLSCPYRFLNLKKNVCLISIICYRYSHPYRDESQRSQSHQLHWSQLRNACLSHSAILFRMKWFSSSSVGGVHS